MEYATWTEGRDALDPGALGAVFAEEMAAAGVPVSGTGQNLFGEDAPSDLRVGVLITDMKGRFCRGCGWNTPTMSWIGDVVLETHWEIYSQLQAKVVATFDATGGFTAPKSGLAGDPERLIYEALRDSIRRLTSSDAFRRAVTTDSAPGPLPVASAIGFTAPAHGKVALDYAVKSVVSVFAGDSLGSGVLISMDGYILTNHHVAGSSGKVRIHWADGVDTVGEVVRGDPRRDVALIKTAPRANALPIRHTPVQLGETVFAIGTPLDKDLAGTLTRGVVSSNRQLDGQPWIQSDVAVTHGNSGGPLLDESGAILGLTDWGVAPNGVSANINFFIPIEDALRVLSIQPTLVEVAPPDRPVAAKPTSRK